MHHDCTYMVWPGGRPPVHQRVDRLGWMRSFLMNVCGNQAINEEEECLHGCVVLVLVETSTEKIKAENVWLAGSIALFPCHKRRQEIYNCRHALPTRVPSPDHVYLPCQQSKQEIGHDPINHESWSWCIQMSMSGRRSCPYHSWSSNRDEWKALYEKQSLQRRGAITE